MGGLPQPLGSLVHRCLSKDPAVRPSARGVLGGAGGRRSAADQTDAANGLRSGRGWGDTQLTAGVGRAACGPRPRPHRRRAGVQATAGAAQEWPHPAAAAGGCPSGRGSAGRRAGGIAFNLPRHGAAPEQLAGSQAGISQELAAEAAARAAAITWIRQQVSPGAVVSCDAQVCGDLASSGFPPSSLSTLGSTSNDPLGSALLVATATVRNQFRGLLSVYAPAVIASFGTGHAMIQIRWIFPGGVRAYGPAMARGAARQENCRCPAADQRQYRALPHREGTAPQRPD